MRAQPRRFKFRSTIHASSINTYPLGMGVLSRRRRPTTLQAFEAEAIEQEIRRPPTRPRPPPIANNHHTAPLWSEHLHSYVSYCWKEHQWKRWSTTAKVWKVIKDINVVIRAESKLFEKALEGVREMPQKPEEPGWSDVLWYEAEKLFVSYNSEKGTWQEWSQYDPIWQQAKTSSWKMPVSIIATEEKDEKHLKTESKDSQATESVQSQETLVASSSSVLQARNPRVTPDPAGRSQEDEEAAPSARKMGYKRFLKLPYGLN
jgi:hypothetical protein